jgi:hypothetical protein
MNWIWISVANLAINLVLLAYFFGWHFGTFNEFKRNVEEKLDRLDKAIFGDVKVVTSRPPHLPFGETEEQTKSLAARSTG